MVESFCERLAKPGEAAGAFVPGFPPQRPQAAATTTAHAARAMLLRRVNGIPVRYPDAMNGTAVSRRSSRVLAVLAAIAGVAFVGAVGWITWAGVAGRGHRASTPPPPAVPTSQLLSVARPVAAPPLDLPTLGGGRFDLASARGQVVLVALWATWCAPCTQEMPTLVGLAREYAEKQPGSLRVVALSLDDQPGAVERFFSAPVYGGPPRELAIAMEPGGGAVSRAYACAARGACRPEDLALPETYLLDPEGRIVAFVVGGLDWSTPGVRQLVEALVARRSGAR